MKRDPRLRGLSSDHHHALVLARRISERVAEGEPDAVFARLVTERFERELEPHFAIEEEVLLPALRAAGETALVERTEADHAFLRVRIAEAAAGTAGALAVFGERLVEHVRFEEVDLFAACEAKLAAEVLEEVARRSAGKTRAKEKSP